MGWLFLFPAFFAAAAAIPLLFFDWFEPRGNFLVLFSEVEGIDFYPSAFETSGARAVFAVLLALTAMGATVAVARGVFVAWTVGAAAAAAGALVCLLLRASPPRPGHGVHTPPEVALQPTTVPHLATACFVLSAVSLTIWALGAKRRL